MVNRWKAGSNRNNQNEKPNSNRPSDSEAQETRTDSEQAVCVEVGRIGSRERERINDRGERLFRDVLESLGLDGETINYSWDSRQADTQRKFQRHSRYYSEGLNALQINATAITAAEQAEQVLARVLLWLRNERPHELGGQLSMSVCEGVRGAVCVMYSYRLNWARLTESRVLKGVMISGVQRPLHLE
jgi:hypothetical protein